MKKTFLILIAVAAVLVAAFFALNGYIRHEELKPGAPIEAYRGTLSGEFVCLPHADQTGPQTLECANGIKTDSGEYYAVDTSLMSTTPVMPETGKRFTANGVITPVELLNTDQWKKYNMVGIFSITDSLIIDADGTTDTKPPMVINPPRETEPQACQMDAKICPDGSAVGRQGPRCEFAACPAADATSARLTTYIGGSPTALGVTISPNKVVSDSRCPLNVNCVWAGTVEVVAGITADDDPSATIGQYTFTLGKPLQFRMYTVTLVEVTPAKTKEEIPDSSYRFTFQIEKQAK